MADFLDKEVTKIIKQFPAITVSHGSVSIDIPEPHYILDEKTGKPIFIIDTTGNITSLDGTDALALITGTEILVKRDGAETQRIDLSKVDNYYIDRSILYRFTDSFKQWFVVFLYPFAVFFSFIYHILQVLIYAALFLVFIRKFDPALNYQVLVRLAVISITPVTVFESLLIILGIVIPYWWFISLLLPVVYLYYAVKVISEQDDLVAG